MVLINRVGMVLLFSLLKLALRVVANWDDFFKPRGQYRPWWKLARETWAEGWQEFKNKRRPVTSAEQSDALAVYSSDGSPKDV